MLNLIAVLQDNAPLLGMDLLLGIAGACLVSRHARAMGLIDAPSARSSHIVPTPKGGGIGILAAFILTCLVLGLNSLLCLTVTLLALLSLIGDRNHLAPGLRLVLQFSAAAIVVFLLPESPFYLLPTTLLRSPLLIVGTVMALIFIVGTANFYNFMDGVNGIAAITGVVGFGLLAGYGAKQGLDSHFLVLGIGLALACLGFLPFNIPRARVFMGDVGSILLGFVFAFLVVVLARSVREFIVLAAFLFPFYADELVTMAERIRLRQSLTAPHRRHLYQVLANEGDMPHWQVSTIYGVLQLIVGLSVWLVAGFGLLAVLVLLLVWSGLFFLLNYRIKRRYLAPS